MTASRAAALPEGGRSMIQVYGSPHSRAFRTLWMLDELGLDYRSIPVDTHAGANRRPEFLALNPNGRVPTLVDGDIVVWESMAINLYLARRYDGGLAPRGIREDAKALQWSFWAVTEVEEALLAYGRNTLFLPEEARNTAAAATSAAQLAKALGVLEAELAERDHLLGDRFSVADLNVASVLFWASLVEFDVSDFPRVRRWLDACLARARESLRSQVVSYWAAARQTDG
jgi:glutathione S-transferase